MVLLNLELHGSGLVWHKAERRDVAAVVVFHRTEVADLGYTDGHKIWDYIYKTIKNYCTYFNS